MRSYLSRVENGHLIPMLGTLEKWASALGIPLYQLFYDGTSDVAPHVEPDFPRDNNELQLRNFRIALKKMSNCDRQILFAVAQQMTELGVICRNSRASKKRFVARKHEIAQPGA